MHGGDYIKAVSDRGNTDSTQMVYKETMCNDFFLPSCVGYM